MAALVEAIHGSTGTTSQSPTNPLTVQCLDSLTVSNLMPVFQMFISNYYIYLIRIVGAHEDESHPQHCYPYHESGAVKNESNISSCAY